MDTYSVKLEGTDSEHSIEVVMKDDNGNQIGFITLPWLRNKDHIISISTHPGYDLNYAMQAYHILLLDSLHEIKGNFTKGELNLMFDTVNGHMLTPILAGHSLISNVEDAIALRGLDQKWQIDGPLLMKKLESLGRYKAAALEIYTVAFWEQEHYQTQEKHENFLNILLGKGDNISEQKNNNPHP